MGDIITKLGVMLVLLWVTITIGLLAAGAVGIEIDSRLPIVTVVCLFGSVILTLVGLEMDEKSLKREIERNNKRWR